MDVVLLVGAGLVAVVACWELVRRAVLGNRMDRSFQMAARADVATPRSPVRAGALLIKAARQEQSPTASFENPLPEFISPRGRSVPLHARTAS
jgi:hypothetical protein